MISISRLKRGFAAVALACSVLGHHPAVSADGCQLKLGASVPIIRMDPSPTMLVPARIGNTTLRMMFDTGASTTLIEGRKIVFGRIIKSEITGAGGTVTVWATSNVPIKLDRLWMTLGHAVVTDSETPLYGGKFDGLLGSDALLQFDFEVDPQASRINIFSQEHCPGEVVYWANEYSEIPFTRSDNHQIAVPVTINGKLLRGIIDTGASRSVISWKAARDEFNLTPASPGVATLPTTTLSGDGRSLSTSQYTFDSVEFGSLRVRNAVVNILNQYSSSWLTRTFDFDDDAPQVVIGMDVLQHLRFYVANEEQKIYFTVVPPSAAPPP